MQEMQMLQTDAKRPCALSRATRSAARALRTKDALSVLAMAYLFCVVALFALSFLLSALTFFLVFLIARVAFVFWMIGWCLAGVVVVAVFLPLWVGTFRMAGKAAVGEVILLSDLFHYFTSRRAWWRGVRIALLFSLALLLPPLFSAPALAIGNEALPLGRVLSLSWGRVSLLAILGFWARFVLRLVLGILTLGLLWLMYDAHHIPVTYFALVMQGTAEPSEENS